MLHSGVTSRHLALALTKLRLLRTRMLTAYPRTRNNTTFPGWHSTWCLQTTPRRIPREGSSDTLYLDSLGRVCNFAGDVVGSGVGSAAGIDVGGQHSSDIPVDATDLWIYRGLLRNGNHIRTTLHRKSRQAAHHRARRFASSSKGAGSRRGQHRWAMERLVRRISGPWRTRPTRQERRT